MTSEDWRSVLDQAADIGVSMIQFIGGEPTLHPAFEDLLRHALKAGLAVEIYSNLIHIRDSWWDLFSYPKVSLATSYYSDRDDEHDFITGRRGSRTKTFANIEEAVARNIPIRAGIVEVTERQRIEQAYSQLVAIGVNRIKIDRRRNVGRGTQTSPPDSSQLCGNCGQGVAAVLPSGDVCPCVFARWLSVGNVQTTPLAEILASQGMAETTATILSGIPSSGRDACSPDDPGGCAPASDGQCGPSKSPW